MGTTSEPNSPRAPLLTRPVRAPPPPAVPARSLKTWSWKGLRQGDRAVHLFPPPEFSPKPTRFHGWFRPLRDRPVTPSSLRTNLHVRPVIWRHPHLLDRGRLYHVSVEPGNHRLHSPTGQLSYRHVLLRSIVLLATIGQPRTRRSAAPMSAARPCAARVERRTQLRLLRPGRRLLHNPLQFGRDRHAARLYDRRNNCIAAF